MIRPRFSGPSLSATQPARSQSLPSSAERQADTPRAPATHAGPFSWLLLVLVLAVVAGIFIGPSLRGDRVGILVTTRNVEPGQVLTDQDIALSTRGGGDRSGYATSPSGRIALKALPVGTAIHRSDLGPNVAASLGTDLTMVPVEVPAAGLLGSILRVGDAVRIITGLGSDRQQAFPGIALQIGRRADDHDFTLTLAVLMRRTTANRYLGVASKAGITVVRDMFAVTQP